MNERLPMSATVTFTTDAVKAAMEVVVAAVHGKPVSRIQVHAATTILHYTAEPIPTNDSAFSLDDVGIKDLFS
jgi:hypothetical protein